MSSHDRDLSGYVNQFGWRNKIARSLWGIAWAILFWPSPRPLHAWRRFLLRCFGANIGRGVLVWPNVRVWTPWTLHILDHSWVGEGVDCYNVDVIRIGPNAVVSQRTFLCTASHDYEDPGFRLITAPIVIGPTAWVAAEAFIAPGVTVGKGAVVGARASVFSDVAAWTVVGGNPARVIKQRSPTKCSE